MDLLNISQCEYEFYNIALYQPTIKELANIYNSKWSTVNNIVKRLTWKHIK